MGFQITIKDNELKTELTKLQTKVRNLKPLLNQVGYYLLEVVENSFENEADANGKAWQELSPSYLNYKNKKGYTKKLQNRGTLAESIDFTTTTDALILGTNIEYAAIHQFGGFAGRNKSAFIPARPFLPIDENGHMYQDVINDILYMLKGYIQS